jgi:hypothetical protein
MLRIYLLSATLVGLISGCSRLPPTAGSVGRPETSKQIQTRNNAASLLFDLLNDEKNVDKVLIVKSAGPEVTGLIKRLAATAATHARELEDLATNDPALNLGDTALPPGEKAARDATAKSKEHDLLFSTGASFEFNLLLSQVEAQNYGWHLASVAAENSSRPEEVRTFKHIREAMEKLDAQSVALLRSTPGR